MRKLVAAAVAIVLCMSWAVTASAQVNVAVSDWRQFCFETRGDAEEAFRRADAAGWTASPQGEGRMLEAEGGRHTLMFVQPRPQGTRLCMVSHPTGGPDLATAVEALIGHPPSYRDGAFSNWIFENVSGELSSIASDDVARAREAFGAGGAVVVRAGIEQGLDIVIYEFMPSN